MQHPGEAAALGAALCWTGSSLFFGLAGRRAGSLAVNQFRILLAVPVLLLLHVGLTGDWWPVHLPEDRVLLLAASGVVGLVLGDLGFFHALAVIGPRISSVLMSTWPAMAMLLAWAFGEAPPRLRELGGLLLTTAGIVLVLLRAREGSAWNTELTRGQHALGVAAGLLGALGQALGVALARPALQAAADLPAGVGPWPATLVRIVTGCIGIQLLAIARGRMLAFANVPRTAATREALLGTLCGPVAGVLLSMVAVRHARSAGIAAALMATTPLFMMPVAWVVYRARIGWLGVGGTLLAVAGVSLLVSG